MSNHRGFTLARLRLAAGLVVLLGITAACSAPDKGSDQSSSDGDEGVAVFLSSSANTFVHAILEGAEETAAEMDAGEVTDFDANFDPSAQAAQIQDAVTSGRYQVFIVEPIDAAGIVRSLERAAADGIEVVCVITSCGEDINAVTNQFEGQAGVVGYSYARLGEEMAASAIEACGDTDPCRVAHINGDSTFASDRSAGEAFSDALAAEPSIELVSQQDGAYDTATARQIAQDILQRNPDLDVLVSHADQMTVGAAQAIETAGLAGDVRIISAGAGEQAAQAIEAGDWFAEIIFQPRTAGAEAAEIGLLSARGDAPESTEVDGFTLSEVGTYLTQDNVADFTPEWR